MKERQGETRGEERKGEVGGERREAGIGAQGVGEWWEGGREGIILLVFMFCKKRYAKLCGSCCVFLIPLCPLSPRRTSDIRGRCGPDATLYLSLHIHIIVLLCVLTIISVGMVLPINYLAGNLGGCGNRGRGSGCGSAANLGGCGNRGGAVGVALPQAWVGVAMWKGVWAWQPFTKELEASLVA